MKVYFTASIAGKKELENNYRLIVDTLRSMGNEVVADHVLGVSSEELLSESIDKREDHFNQVKKWIGGADLVVAEVSHPSTNVGYEISMALDREKPVLCLHIVGRVPVLLMGVASDKLRVSEYGADNLKQTLKLDTAELSTIVDTRFNFFVSPQIQSYLDWVAKSKRVPRAVYLRRLIEEDMKKNQDYQKD